MQPDLASVRADRPALGLDRLDLAVPQRLEHLEDARELVRLEVVRDRNADHVLRVGSEQCGHARIDVRHVHVDADACDPEGRMVHDLVEQLVAMSDLPLGAPALAEQVERIAMGQHLVGDEQDADAGGEDGFEPVQVVRFDRHDDRRDGRAERREPWKRQLPQLDRAVDPALVDRVRRPQRRERDQQVADHPAGVEDAANRAIRAVRGQVREGAVGKRVEGETSDQQHHVAKLGPARAPQSDDQDRGEDDVAERIGEAEKQGASAAARARVHVAEP